MVRHHRLPFLPPVWAAVAGLLLVRPLAVFAVESAGDEVRPALVDSAAVAAASARADSAARSHLASGDYVGAIARYERELLAARASLPSGHPALAVLHERLGTVSWTMGDYERARTELEAALLIYERAHGPEHPAIAGVLDRMASLALELGDAPAAVRLQKRALAIAEKESGSGPRTAAALEGLGTALAAAGDVKAAEAAHLRALGLHGKAGDSLSVAGCLQHLARDAERLGDRDRARAYLLRSKSALSDGVGADHPGMAVTVAGLGALAAAEGDLDRARAHAREAVVIRRHALGAEHPLLAEALTVYAASLIRTGHNLDALDAALEAETIRRRHLRFLARSLPESQALRYEARLASGLGTAVAVSIRTWDSTVVERVWDAAARSRALVLDEVAARRRWTDGRWGADGATLALAAEAVRTRQSLARLSMRGPAGMDPRAYRAMLERLRSSSEEMERTLLERNPDMRAGSARANAGLAQVRAALPRGSGLVSLVRYLDPTAGTRGAGRSAPAGSGVGETWSYAAFVTSGAATHARVVPLGDAVELDSLVAAWRRGVNDRTLGRILRQRLWDPIAPHLAGVTRVVFVPDGAFHLVNPLALPTGEDRFLVEEGPTFQIVSSERDLVPAARPEPSGTGFLALADPDFDAPRRSMSAVDPVREWNPSSREDEDPVYRGSRPCAVDSVPPHWRSLPGSASEVEEIGRLWERSGGGAPEILQGAAATEGSFKKLAPGKRALHLATHGFFAGACEGENPLERSGLVLAGANRGPAGADSARPEDGILTADEISAMDLGGVEWAVLSGCETGVGAVRAGEGVFGLRRAFEIAGARSLVLTLWPVTDRAAREWTIRFYEARLTKGLDPASAARDASLRVLEERRAAGSPADPSAWGAFIAAGR